MNVRYLSGWIIHQLVAKKSSLTIACNVSNDLQKVLISNNNSIHYSRSIHWNSSKFKLVILKISSVLISFWNYSQSHIPGYIFPIQLLIIPQRKILIRWRTNISRRCFSTLLIKFAQLFKPQESKSLNRTKQSN